MVSEGIIRKNRTIFDTIEAILLAAQSPTRVSLLSRFTGIRWDMLLECLAICINKGLVEVVTDVEDKKRYQTTVRGKSYLQSLNRVKEMLNYETEAENLIF